MIVRLALLLGGALAYDAAVKGKCMDSTALE